MKCTSSFISTLVCICIFYQTYGQKDDTPAGTFFLLSTRKGFIATFGYTEKAYEVLKERVPILKKMMSAFHGIKAKEENFTINFDDILLSPRQVERLINAYNKALKKKEFTVTFQTPKPPKGKGRRSKRKVLDFDKEPEEKWDASKDIIYVIDRHFKKKFQDLIVEAIEHWQNNTCLNFKRRFPKEIFPKEIINEDYIFFMNEKGIAIHEIGHALGFVHEQSRLGASKYIDVDLSNIQKDDDNAKLQFKPWVEGFQEDFGVPYDFGSIMHYGAFDFTASGDPVITAKNLLFQKNMGQRVELSFLDIKAANIAYKCADKCSSPPSCQNGGIPDSRDCSKCICPDGLGGKTCTTVDSDHTSGCTTPQIIGVKSSEQCVESPKYGSESYEVGTECNWHLQAPSSNKIKVYFKGTFGVYRDFYSKACFHWVEIKYKEPVKSDIPGPRFCHNKTPTQVFVSDGNLVVVSFKGLVSAKVDEKKGFKLCFKFDDGGVNVKTSTPVKTPKTTPSQTGCVELICSTMVQWQIYTKPNMSQNTFKQAIKKCKPKRLKVKTNIKFVIYSRSASGKMKIFTMKKLCVKSVGSRTTLVILRGPGGSVFTSLPFLPRQRCLRRKDFEDTGKVEEITVVITKKRSVKVMKISDLELKVCKLSTSK